MAGPTIQKSVLGKMFGINKDGFSVAKDQDVVAATSATTGTDLLNGGITTLSSAATVWRLDPPTPGLLKTITSLSTSTSNRAVTLESGNFVSTGGSTFTTLVFQGLNYGVELLGLSTALYAVTSNRNAIASTSTST